MPLNNPKADAKQRYSSLCRVKRNLGKTAGGLKIKEILLFRANLQKNISETDLIIQAQAAGNPAP